MLAVIARPVSVFLEQFLWVFWVQLRTDELVMGLFTGDRIPHLPGVEEVKRVNGAFERLHKFDSTFTELFI